MATPIDPTTISNMYQSIMGQAPAQDTLNYFTNDINNNGKSLGDLSNTLSSFVQNNGGPLGSNFSYTAPATQPPAPTAQDQLWGTLNTYLTNQMQQQGQPPAWLAPMMGMFQQNQTPSWATSLQDSLNSFMQGQSGSNSSGGLGGLGGWGTGGYTNSPVYHPQPTNGFQGWGNSSPFRPTF